MERAWGQMQGERVWSVYRTTSYMAYWIGSRRVEIEPAESYDTLTRPTRKQAEAEVAARAADINAYLDGWHHHIGEQTAEVTVEDIGPGRLTYTIETINPSLADDEHGPARVVKTVTYTVAERRLRPNGW